MEPKYDSRFEKHLDRIIAVAKSLPLGQKNTILNNCYALKGTVRKATKHPAFEVTLDEQTSKQIADRYNANLAIFAALKAGRHISLKDSREFAVSEMHTQMHCIRKRIENNRLPYILKSRWIDVSLSGKRCKEYWLETPETQTV